MKEEASVRVEQVAAAHVGGGRGHGDGVGLKDAGMARCHRCRGGRQ